MTPTVDIERRKLEQALLDKEAAETKAMEGVTPVHYVDPYGRLRKVGDRRESPPRRRRPYKTLVG